MKRRGHCRRFIDFGDADLELHSVRFRSVEDRQLKETFADRLKTLRSRLGVSQDEFAMRFSIDVKTLRGWEGGKVADRGNRRLISMIEKDPELADRLVNDE